MQDLIEDAARRSARYIDALKERRVAPPPKAVERLKGFDVPLQEGVDRTDEGAAGTR
jgi:hypothetical protein